MGKLFDRIVAGLFLACALGITVSLNYYYEQIAFADKPWGAVVYTLGLIWCCSWYCILTGDS